MLFKPVYNPTSFCRKRCIFFEPCKLRIRKPDKTEVLMGYGIGDSVEILTPSMVCLVPSYKKLKEIPLSDGSFIIEFIDKFGNNLMADATEIYEAAELKNID